MTWPLCLCGCGEPVVASVRTGRPTRYATRKCGQRAARQRALKRQERNRKKRCVTCGQVKPWSAFDSKWSKRCKTCKHQVISQPCRICGEPTGMGARYKARRLCGRPECQSEWHSVLRKATLVKQQQKIAARKTRRCPNCDRRKPLTAEFWSPGPVRKDNLPSWDSYCKSCRAALMRDRHRRNPELREKRIARQARHREEVRARRAIDPIFDEQVRQKIREYDRRSRARRAEREIAANKPHYAGGPEIPAFPLAAFIDREATREQRQLNGHAPDMDETLESVCRNLGVDSRRVREWRKQPNAAVRLDVADRVITNAGRLWFDIYDEERFPVEHRLAAMAFQGVAA